MYSGCGCVTVLTSFDDDLNINFLTPNKLEPRFYSFIKHITSMDHHFLPLGPASFALYKPTLSYPHWRPPSPHSISYTYNPEENVLSRRVCR